MTFKLLPKLGTLKHEQDRRVLFIPYFVLPSLAFPLINASHPIKKHLALPF